MSINSALQAGVSGLVSNSSALASISDNIANVNSVGYKRTRTDFTTLVQQAAVPELYSAGGVTTANRQLISQQGLLSATASSTDLGISGAGLFVVSPQSGPLQTSGDVLFTRVGSFTPDETGNFKNQAGFYLQGWRVAADGSVDTNPSDLSNLETVNIGNISGTAQATTDATINGNLRASQPVSAAATLAIPSATYDPANSTINMASGAVTPDVRWSFESYDSRGGLKSITVSLLKTNVANEWAAEIHVEPASVINNAGSGLVDGQLRTGTLVFTTDGRLDLASASNIALLADLQINEETAAPVAGQPRWAVGEGVSTQTIALNLGQGSAGGGITQYDSPSVQVSTQTNGAVFGDLVSVEVDKTGFVTANYNNGVSRRVFQIPLATFQNPNGLSAENGGVFRVTSDSGSFNFKPPGLGGSGLLSARSLESSNVDLANEFTGLITTQRAYSASAKIVTTADEMLDELIRIKR